MRLADEPVGYKQSSKLIEFIATYDSWSYRGLGSNKKTILSCAVESDLERCAVYVVLKTGGKLSSNL